MTDHIPDISKMVDPYAAAHQRLDEWRLSNWKRHIRWDSAAGIHMVTLDEPGKNASGNGNSFTAAVDAAIKAWEEKKDA